MRIWPAVRMAEDSDTLAQTRAAEAAVPAVPYHCIVAVCRYSKEVADTGMETVSGRPDQRLAEDRSLYSPSGKRKHIFCCRKPAAFSPKEVGDVCA